MHLYSQLIQAETGDVIKQSVRCNQVVTTTEGYDTQALFVPHPSVWYLYSRNLVHGPRHHLTVRRTPTMSDLIALVLDSREQAQEARQEFMKM